MKVVLGIDLGTSSAKLVVTGYGPPRVMGIAYPEDAPLGAIGRAVAQLCDPREIEAVGLSGQTGTFLISDAGGRVRARLPWYAPGRAEPLKRLLAAFSESEFVEMTGMVHPALASYPLPTALAIREDAALSRLLEDALLLQPKDQLCLTLCGRAASDVGSWRGLVHPGTRAYPERLLAFAGLEAAQLPPMEDWLAVSAEGAAQTGLRPGTPVAVGANDFYAALNGMGVDGPGACFDVTGTSEHFGVVVGRREGTKLIESPYKNGFARYGVTACAGVSLDWARRLFGPDAPEIHARAPIFLPYLRGERAPVFDERARGLFVGLTDQTSTDALKYAVYEGVVFSIYSVWEALGRPKVREIRATGGASTVKLLNELKASVFGVSVVSESPACGSALGAARYAGGEWAKDQSVTQPDAALGERLRGRYAVYARMVRASRDMLDGVDTADMFGG
ncbi:FGGY-family carbohydrate kinase [Bacillota bacterium Meth-B3]